MLQPPFRLAPAWLAAAALAVCATGAVVWALALQGRLDDERREVAEQRSRLQQQAQQLDEIRSRANATAYSLAPTVDGPAGASGTVLFSLPDRFGVLYVRGLPALEPDRDYQIWYLDGESVLPGGTFDVDAQGLGVATFSTDVPTLDGVALTVEPTGGSLVATSPVMLAGTVGGAAG